MFIPQDKNRYQKIKIISRSCNVKIDDKNKYLLIQLHKILFVIFLLLARLWQ